MLHLNSTVLPHGPPDRIKTMKQLALSLASVLIIIGCTSEPASLRDEQHSEIVEQLTAMHDSLRLAWMSGDAASQGRYHLAEGMITYDSRRFTGEAFQGWAERTGTDGPKQQVGELRNLQIDVASSSSAHSVFDYEFAFLDSLGNPNKEMVALMTLAWAKADDHWRVLHLHESTYDVEPSEE